jgi:hypothetical protein
MSANSRPSDRVRRCSAGATTDPAGRSPLEVGPASGPHPPIIAGEQPEGEPVSEGEFPEDMPPAATRVKAPRTRRLVRKPDEPTPPLTGEQRLLLLDTWRRSGLPAGDFGAPVGISKHTLYSWKKKFEMEGPAGLAARPAEPGDRRQPSFHFNDN